MNLMFVAEKRGLLHILAGVLALDKEKQMLSKIPERKYIAFLQGNIKKYNNEKNTNRNNRMRWDGKIARCKDESSLKKN